MASGKDTVALQVKIKRYQPEEPREAEAYWQEFRVEADPHDRLLDVLNKIKWEQDGTLTYRRSCAHGVCGSDAMRVNGRNRLACKLLVQDVGRRINIEPMLGFPVIRDLVVDMDPFFAKYEKVKPFLINDEPLPRTERPPIAGAARALRRHDEVHPLRRLHRLLSFRLGQPRVGRPSLHRQRAPLHLRQPRPWRAGALADPWRPQRRLALPHDLQLHGGVSAWHPRDRGD